MYTYAYLRVSTDKQDAKNQKLGVLDYCNANGLGPIKFIEDTVSGKQPWQERELGNILAKAKPGDVLVAAEISRLGRSTLQVLEILAMAAEKQVSVHIAKNRMIMDGSMQATITATILGLAAQIEREFISERTKEALLKCRAEGKTLGRPKGPAQFLKLDAYQDEILEYIRKGINKTAISKLIECSPMTLYAWLKRRKIQIKKK